MDSVKAERSSDNVLDELRPFIAQIKSALSALFPDFSHAAAVAEEIHDLTGAKTEVGLVNGEPTPCVDTASVQEIDTAATVEQEKVRSKTRGE